MESTLSGHAQVAILNRAKELGYQIEIHYLWLPSPKLAIGRVAQRVKKGGHDIPRADILRRYDRSIDNFLTFYAPLADTWLLWDNSRKPIRLQLDSNTSSLTQLKATLRP